MISVSDNESYAGGPKVLILSFSKLVLAVFMMDSIVVRFE